MKGSGADRTVAASAGAPGLPRSARCALARSRGRPAEAWEAFTLLELLAAIAIFGVILAGLASTFHTALRARERAYERIEADIPNYYVTEIIKRDIACAVPPTGILASGFLGTKQESGDARLDELEFFTASGVLNETDPWGDVQKVAYYLEEPDADSSVSNTPPSGQGLDLVRAVTRNLLALVEEEPEEQRLLRGVRSLQFQYYDGQNWLDSWDSTTQENASPTAVGVRIEFPAPAAGETAPPALEIVTAIEAKSATPQPSSANQPSQEGGAPPGEQTPPPPPPGGGS